MERETKHSFWRRPLRSLPQALAAVILGVGLGLLLYPAVGELIARARQETLIDSFEQSIENADEAELADEWALARAFQESAGGGALYDPFWDDGEPTDEDETALPAEYLRVLNVRGDGVMGYLTIPDIDVHLPILHGTGEEALARGVGHIMQTALPIGGEGSHCVLTGHRGLPNAALLTRLDETEPGDVFYIHVLDETLAYTVEDVTVILPEELELYYSENDGAGDTVTLMTCTPYGENTHRLMVRGRRTAYTPEAAEAETGGSVRLVARDVYSGFGMTGVWIALGIIALLIAAAFVSRAENRRRTRNETDAARHAHNDNNP